MKTISLSQSPLYNVVVWSFFWAFQILVTKLAFSNGAQIGAYITQTSLTTFSISLFFLLPKMKAEAKELLKEHPRIFYRLLLANLSHLGLAGIFYTTSLAFSTATSIGFLSKLSIVFVLVMAHFFLKEKLTPIKIFNCLMMFVGAYFLIAYGKEIQGGLGSVLIIAACFFWSLANVIIKAQMQLTQISGELVSTLRPLVGAPVLISLCAVLPLLSPNLQTTFGGNYLDSSITIYAIFNAIFTVGVWIFLNRSLKVATASYVSMMSMINPLIVAVLGYALLGESLTNIQMFGCLLIILGGFLAEFKARETRPN